MEHGEMSRKAYNQLIRDDVRQRLHHVRRINETHRLRGLSEALLDLSVDIGDSENFPVAFQIARALCGYDDPAYSGLSSPVNQFNRRLDQAELLDQLAKEYEDLANEKAAEADKLTEPEAHDRVSHEADEDFGVAQDMRERAAALRKENEEMLR